MRERDLQPKGPSSAGTWCCLGGGRIYTEAPCDSVDSPDMRAAAAAYAAGGGPPIHLRTAAQLEPAGAGLEFLAPVGPVNLWHPAEPAPEPVDQWGFVARKPLAASDRSTDCPADR